MKFAYGKFGLKTDPRGAFGILNMATEEQLDTPMPALNGMTGRELLTRSIGS